MSLTRDEIGSLFAEWFAYAKNFGSKDIVMNKRGFDDFATIGYMEGKDSKPALPINRKIGNIVFFDSITPVQFAPFVDLVAFANGEKLERNKALLGQNVHDETISSKIGGRGVRVGGVNQNDHLLTLTMHLIPTDEEYLKEFLGRKTAEGGVEEQIVQYWHKTYGLMTKEMLDEKIENLLKLNVEIVDKAKFKAYAHKNLAEQRVKTNI
ncbi:hypothetical protein [Alteromonas antoniana]|uniref:hypothetical protein n=1 Tax=Alteromonas antoniana TaxID=2803813 RepID=UPI001C45F530|nr:hypothetical protein [Alteromonas antoniana]